MDGWIDVLVLGVADAVLSNNILKAFGREPDPSIKGPAPYSTVGLKATLLQRHSYSYLNCCLQ